MLSSVSQLVVKIISSSIALLIVIACVAAAIQVVHECYPSLRSAGIPGCLPNTATSPG